MQMSGTSNVCRKLQIMSEEQRDLLSARGSAAGDPRPPHPLREGGGLWMAEMRGPALPGLPPRRLWVLHGPLCLPPWLPPSCLPRPASTQAFRLGQPCGCPSPPTPTSQFSFWGILLHFSVLCLSRSLPCPQDAAERIETALQGETAPHPRSQGSHSLRPPAPHLELKMDSCTQCRRAHAHPP